jgi:hypothetical protein
MNSLYKRTRMLRWYILMNTMPKVKDMPGAVTKSLKDSRNFLLNSSSRRIQHGWIHVSLQRNFVTDTAASIGNIRTPI